jgi:hypothetical protein
MSRNRDNKGNQRWKSVSIPLDEETAAQLDQAMLSFGLESRGQVAAMAVQAWLAAVLENATIHAMCQQAVEQIRKNEFGALSEFYMRRAKEMGY